MRNSFNACLFPLFQPKKLVLKKANVQSPFGWDQNTTFWKKLRLGFVKKTRKMGKELRGPFWKNPMRIESTICWTLWAITKLPFNKSEDVLIFFLWYTQTPTQTHPRKRIEPARATPPKCKSHHPPNTIQPSPPNHHHHHLLKPPPPKPVKTTETQNTTKIKHDLPKIHKK